MPVCRNHRRTRSRENAGNIVHILAGVPREMNLGGPSARGRPHCICSREVPGGPRLARLLSPNPREFRMPGYEATNRFAAVHLRRAAYRLRQPGRPKPGSR